MTISTELIYQVPDARFSLISRDDGGVLLLPWYAGEPFSKRPAAAFAPDGLSFAEVRVDVSALPSPQAPVLSSIGRHVPSQATENNLLPVRSESEMFEVTVGSEVTVRRCAYRSPQQWRFVLHALTFHDGMWWAGGHDSQDDLLGELHYSKDGASWSKVPGKYDSIKHLTRHAGKLYALWFKNIDEVSTTGLVQAAKFKWHVEDATIGSAGVVGAGPDFGVGVLPPKAKRAKYSQPLPGRTMGRLAALPGGFLLGEHTGLWASRDGVGWEVVTPKLAVVAICSSKDHAVVLTAAGEVHAVRIDER